MKCKKKKKGRLVFTLCIMLMLLLFSAGGLSILNGVNAGGDENPNPPVEDKIEAVDQVNGDYNYQGGESTKKEVVKLTSAIDCAKQITKFFESSCYSVTANGIGNVQGQVHGVTNLINVCDLEYLDNFERDSLGRVYWEEGFKLGKFYNGTIESLFNMYKGMFVINVAQYNSSLFLNDDAYLQLHIVNEKVKFTDGFNLPQQVLDEATISTGSNNAMYEHYGYKNRAFRWIINEDTMENAIFTKLVNGYKLEFDLVDEGVRDVYKRLVTWIPDNVANYKSPTKFHYVFNLDRYGNVTSFNRDETIDMKLTGKSIGINLTGTATLRFMFKYDVKLKADNYVKKLSDKFENALNNL